MESKDNPKFLSNEIPFPDLIPMRFPLIKLGTHLGVKRGLR